METREGTKPRAEMSERREFLKKALVTTAYVAPIVMSFSSGELVRAASGNANNGNGNNGSNGNQGGGLLGGIGGIIGGLFK